MSKLRDKTSILINNVAVRIARLGFKPIYLTILSLLTAILALLSLVIYRSAVAYVSLVLISGLLDALDGAVARLMQKTSRLGAFLDSTIDRLSDVIIIYSLTYINYEQFEILVLVALSLLISYVRARSESLGLKIEGVGLIERAERVVLIIIVAALSVFNKTASRIVFYVLVVLSAVTLIQRIVYVIANLEE